MIRSTYVAGWAALALLLQVSSASAALVIQDVTLIDGTGRPARPGQSVLIEGDRIAAIRDHHLPMTRGLTVLDGRGKYLIPGLVDTHIHLEGGRSGVVGPDGKPVMDFDRGRRLLQGFLYNGVTAVYDAANYDQFIFTLREAERSGRMLSPRIFAAGYLLTRTNGYAAGSGGPPVDTYEQGTRALDSLFVNKPDLVKFVLAPHNTGGVQEVPTFDPLLLHRLIIYANEHGFRTTIHAVEDSSQRAAVEAGIDALAHPVYMTATDDTLAPMIAAKGLPVSTTLVVLKNISNVMTDPGLFDAPAFRDVLTDADITRFRDADRTRYHAMGLDTWAPQALEYASTNVRKLYDEGATLALGTDRTIGAYPAMELELIAGLGIPPLQALRIATLNAAIYLHTADRMGSVEEGKLADLVLLNADPVADVRNVRSIFAVILGGKIVDRSQLELPVNHRVARP